MKSVNIVIAVSRTNSRVADDWTCHYVHVIPPVLRSVTNAPSRIDFSPRLLFTQIVNKSSFNVSTSHDSAQFTWRLASSWIFVVTWIYNVKLRDFDTVGKEQWHQMSIMPSHITANSIVRSKPCSGWQQRDTEALNTGRYEGKPPITIEGKWSVMRKTFPWRLFDIIPSVIEVTGVADINTGQIYCKGLNYDDNKKQLAANDPGNIVDV